MVFLCLVLALSLLGGLLQTGRDLSLLGSGLLSGVLPLLTLNAPVLGLLLPAFPALPTDYLILVPTVVRVIADLARIRDLGVPVELLKLLLGLLDLSLGGFK